LLEKERNKTKKVYLKEFYLSPDFQNFNVYSKEYKVDIQEN
jgi:hypothetical protein